MKIASPFVQFIPDCKKTMRRLRKKIYKFITSKHYHRKQENRNDLLNLFREKGVPSFVLEGLTRRKTVDLNSIKNLSVTLRLPLAEIVEITSQQERIVAESQSLWMERSKNRIKQRPICFTESSKEREEHSRRTLSSTEFEYDEGEGESESNLFGGSRESSSQEMKQNLNHDIEFHHFERGNSFLQIESSLLSQENLFKFEQ